MYDDIFQALVVEGDILLLQPFLDLGFESAVRWKLQASMMCLENQKNISEAGNFHLMIPLKPRSRNYFRSRTSPSTARAWKISSCIITSTLTSLGTTSKNRGLKSKHIHVLSLFPLTSIHLK
jgi:hypothetical protein